MKHEKDKAKKVSRTKSYQEMNEEISKNKELKERQPTLDPDDFEEIEY